MKRFFALGAAIAALATSAVAADKFEPSADAMRAHVTFLADDLLQGRMPGTPGYDIAANYVASQFLQLGVKPAGENGTYLQKVPMVSYRSAERGALTLRGGRKPVSMLFGADYRPYADPLGRQVKLTAPMVFVGYGIVAPERSRDDYAGLDVKGKIVVVLGGAPKSLQSEERAYYAGGRTKRIEAAKRGAIGYISVATPSQEKAYPFDKGNAHWRDTSMTWATPDGTPQLSGGQARPLASISQKGAAKLFAGAPVPVETIMAAAETPDGVTPRFELPLTAQVSLTNEIARVDSSNVVGLIEGSDPARKDEYVVLSAHLDHIGTSEPVDGDSINNGALDNAGGIATLLEVARGFEQSGAAPKRSILIVAVTAEEQGLIGADYFAHNPTVPKGSLVADVNLDMPILLYDFQDVVAFGAERSSVGPAVRRAAESMGVKLSPDPLPDEGLFTRSDHYRFVEAGIPAVFLMTGFANGGEAAFTGFLANRYHKPNDDLRQGIDYVAGAKFAKLNYRIARELADGKDRPRWNDGDFFGGKFAK